MHGRRSGVLLLVSGALLSCLGPAAYATGGQVKITKWELNTIHRQMRTVGSGATISFCATDPYYGLSPFFEWTGVPFGDVMTIGASAPGLKTETSRSKTFEAHGQNAYTFNAQAYGAAAKSIPAGRYTIRIALPGSRASSSITLVKGTHC